MAHESKYVIDTKTMTASVDIFINDLLITTYSYEDDMITLSERENTDSIDLTEFSETINSVTEWVGLVRSLLAPADEKRSFFSEEMQKLSGKVEGKFVVSVNQITEMEFETSTELVSFQPRSEMILKFVDFFEWINFLSRGLNIMKNF